jgi:hypothetical protein
VGDDVGLFSRIAFGNNVAAKLFVAAAKDDDGLRMGTSSKPCIVIVI